MLHLTHISINFEPNVQKLKILDPRVNKIEIVVLTDLIKIFARNINVTSVMASLKKIK